MYEAAREKSPHLEGMEGWLVFLVATLLVVGPLGGLASVYKGFVNIEQVFDVAASVSWQRYKAVTWLFFAVSTMFSAGAGYRLCRVRKRGSVLFAAAAMWIAWPVLNLAAILTGMAVLGVANAGGGFWQAVASVGVSVVFASVWTVYLKRSVRVKNTYGLPWSS